MAFPVSLPDDGLIDVMAMTTVRVHSLRWKLFKRTNYALTLQSSRGDLVAAMDGAPKGRSFWHPSVRFLLWFPPCHLQLFLTGSLCEGTRIQDQTAHGKGLFVRRRGAVSFWRISSWGSSRNGYPFESLRTLCCKTWTSGPCFWKSS